MYDSNNRPYLFFSFNSCNSFQNNQDECSENTMHPLFYTDYSTQAYHCNNGIVQIKNNAASSLLTI